jgi:hypothetical protein
MMAERRTHEGRIKSALKPAMTRSETRRLGARLRRAIENQHLMFDQGALGKDGSETSRARETDNSDNQMNKDDDDVAHDGIVSKPSKVTEIWPN